MSRKLAALLYSEVIIWVIRKLPITKDTLCDKRMNTTECMHGSSKVTTRMNKGVSVTPVYQVRLPLDTQ